MNSEPDCYREAHLRETLAERLGDLDLQVQIVGEVVLVTGGVASAEQQASVTEVVTEILPSMTVRNETALPRVSRPDAPERIVTTGR